jgi:succinate dehydrogenase / fumarate reductase cytochrome b subunit
MLTSVLNRFTGLVLSVALLSLVYWLMAVAGGATTQARAERLLALPAVRLAGAGFLMAFCYHLVAGLRHLVWDTGHGLERAQARSSAWLVAAASIVLMVVIGYWAWTAAGRAP